MPRPLNPLDADHFFTLGHMVEIDPGVKAR